MIIYKIFCNSLRVVTYLPTLYNYILINLYYDRRETWGINLPAVRLEFKNVNSTFFHIIIITNKRKALWYTHNFDRHLTNTGISQNNRFQTNICSFHLPPVLPINYVHTGRSRLVHRRILICYGCVCNDIQSLFSSFRIITVCVFFDIFWIRYMCLLTCSYIILVSGDGICSRVSSVSAFFTMSLIPILA